MNKKILLFLAVLLVQFKSIFALMLNYNLSSITPNFPESNSNSTVLLCLNNELYPIKLYSVYLTLNTSDSCIKLDKNEFYFDSIDKSACFLVNLNIENCSVGRYWISIDERYFVNGSIQTGSDYFLFTVYKAPSIVLNYNVSNNYIGKEAKLDLYITNFGSIVKDLVIYTNYSVCDISPKELYIGDLSNETNVSFSIKIPTYASGSCSIPIILSYKDSIGNFYTLPKLISFPIYSLGGRLTLSFDDITIKPGEYKNILIYLSNEGSLTFYNVLVKVNNLPGLSFNKQEIYIDKILPRETKKLILQVYSDVSLAGSYNVPVNISYNDEYGNRYNDIFFINLKVNEEPNISASAWISGSTLYVSVYNFGNIDARGVYIKLNCEGCILDREDSFLGDIEANNYLTDSFKILARYNNSLVRIEIFYKDILGNFYMKSFIKNLGFSEINTQQSVYKSNSRMNIMYIALLAIILVVMIVYYKRRKG
ncbi:MAG: hypothetical protein BXU00_02450 [Candidatus Nanoclepta minutus]|uniref:CARDB domain-containing protein n=1 Tax=Candidatus Nanoclepta minutus TaxID=1940235 RepID=A0A397WM91_9ARCH|nr:MAG: hypothetical protein BXU00_02450 [Candidatus Nanoclepta minutus]